MAADLLGVAGRFVRACIWQTGGQLVWRYDDLGNRASQRNRIDPVPTYSVQWTYDPFGRILTRAADGTVTSSTYDASGNRLTATSGAMAITATYDRLNRVLTVDDEDAGTTPDTTYTYSLTSPSWTDPTGSYTASLDKAGRPAAETTPAAGSWAFTYGATGQMTAATQGNGNTLASTFDAAGRELTRTTKTGSTTRAAYAWTFNRAGLVLSEASTITGDPSSGTVTYGYDPLGRLASSTLGTTVPTTWDAATNRTGQGSSTTVFDPANRPLSGTGPTAVYGSDQDGRLTARPGQTMTWDHLGRLASVTTAAGTTSYAYDPLDRLRTVGAPDGSRTRFRYTGLTTSAAQWIDDLTGTVTRSLATGWAGEHLADWDPAAGASSRRVYGTNAHHDVTWLADSTGSVISSLRYDPWGVPRSAVPAGYTPFRFQGSFSDTGTDLAWVVTRWYAPALGTFISEDSLLGQPRDPDSRHLNAYAQGEPVGRWDPDGRWWRVAHHVVDLSLWESRAWTAAWMAAAGLACVAAAALGQLEIAIPECLTYAVTGSTVDDPNRVEARAIKRQEIWKNAAGSGQMISYQTRVGVRMLTYRWGQVASRTTTWAKHDSIEYFETFVSGVYGTTAELDHVGKQLNDRFWACGGGPLTDYGPESVEGAKGAAFGVCHPWAAVYYQWDDPNNLAGLRWAQSWHYGWDRYYRNKGLGFVPIPPLKW